MSSVDVCGPRHEPFSRADRKFPGRATPAGKVKAFDPGLFSCIIAAEESLQGRISFIRGKRSGALQVEGYARLQSTIEALASLTILPFDGEAARVFQALQSLKLKIGTMDLKIAAICLVHDAVLLTRNLGDFQRVPGLKLENWLD